MAQINKIISLINYDYKYLFYFNNQMISIKKQFVHKYNNENKYQLYLISIEKHNKRIRKKKYYENLYLRNKYMYYIIFSEKVISKYIRKQLYKDVLAIVKSLILNLILEYFDVRKKIQKLLSF